MFTSPSSPLPLGTKVLLRRDSEYAHQAGEFEIGEIFEYKEGLKLPHRVKWSRSLSNYYRDKDLQVLPFKFKVGDKVKVVKFDYGLYPEKENMGKIVTIAEQGIYNIAGEILGYRIEPKLEGNPTNGSFNGFVGESSFELYEQNEELKQQQEQEEFLVLLLPPIK